MDFSDPNTRKFVRRAIGDELRRAREGRGWSRAQFVARLPSGIGERTVLSYEHGARELAVLRLLELCAGLDADPSGVLSFALQRAKVLLENMDLHIDLRALLDNHNPTFRPMHQWARNKMNRNPGDVAKLAPTAVGELADFIGCAHNELTHHLARFVPDAEYE